MSYIAEEAEDGLAPAPAATEAPAAATLAPVPAPAESAPQPTSAPYVMSEGRLSGVGCHSSCSVGTCRNTAPNTLREKFDVVKQT